MEFGQEESFDNASSEKNDGNDAEPNKSDSQVTLQYVRSQESFKRCRDKCISSDLNADVIHFELLVEKGLIDKDYECPDGQDDGDHLRSVARSREGEAIAEIVKTMRNEFMANLSSKKKNFKEMLIKNGMMDCVLDECAHLVDAGETDFLKTTEYQLNENRCLNDYDRLLLVKDTATVETQAHLVNSNGRAVIKDTNSIITFQPDSSKINSNCKPDYKTRALEVTYSSPTETKPFTEFPSKREKEMMQWINEINLFTSGMERDPEKVNWDLFRANLLKMHKHYVTHKPKSFNTLRDHQNALSSADLAADLKGSLKDLGSRFCDKLSHSTIAKDRVDRDLKILALLRDRIDRRLTQMEMDFLSNKNQLFCQNELDV
nr:uncharacterized protein LOC108122911 isoform X2 [Drosophila bipectinata]